MQQPRRTSSTIIYDLLRAVQKENMVASIQDETVKLTNVQLRAKISYDKAKDYLDMAIELGFVTQFSNPNLTPHGFDFIKDYQQLQSAALSFSDRFSLNKNCHNPPIDVTTDYTQFILDIAQTLKDTSKQLLDWTKVQKDNR